MTRAIFLLTLLFGQSLWATTFLETSLEDRLRTAQGVIKGEFMGSSSKRLPSGQVVTEASFKVLGVSGIRPNEIINHQGFKILYPGGSWQGRTYRVHGTPEFSQGEVSYLVIQKGKYGYQLANLAMSKYRPIERNGERFLQSEVFPNKEGIGLISLNEFNELLGNAFGDRMTAFRVDKFIDKGSKIVQAQSMKRGSRSPASRGSSAEREQKTNFSPIWLIIALGILGFISSFLTRGKRDESKNH